MDRLIINRVLSEANYIISTNKTIRDLSKIFGVSKSTVYKDLSERLYEVNIDLFNDVNVIFKNHFLNKYIKGGESTKHKYLCK